MCCWIHRRGTEPAHRTQQSTRPAVAVASADGSGSDKGGGAMLKQATRKRMPTASSTKDIETDILIRMDDAVRAPEGQDFH